MKKKTTENFNGITVCDSIVVSVKKKTRDLRKLEAVIIAVVGFISVIMSFLDMFSFRYSAVPVVCAAMICSAVYIIISVIGKKAVPLYIASIMLFAAAAAKYFKIITSGFKYVYNVIYSVSYQTEINYYKFLKADNEEYCITVFFIFSVWLLALIIYFFTIYLPNPVITVLATFPIIEIGLYNGIKIPIVWGMLTIAYWFALLAVSTTDAGEYSGGSSGFVRKGNLFFPKRHMKLKVTEKCALMVVYSIIAVTLVSIAVMQLTGYERSDKINQRRIAIKQAVNSFSFNDLASSISDLTDSFGFTIDYETHKLGTNSRMTYKNEVELTVTFDKKYDGAIYLKGYSGSIYEDNEWFDLSESDLKKEKEMFGSFEEYSIYPQDFPHIFVSSAYPEMSDTTIWIKQKKNKNKAYAPYCTNKYGDIVYKSDTVISSKEKNNPEYSYKFMGISTETAAGRLYEPSAMTYCINDITDRKLRSKVAEYCKKNDLLINGECFFEAESCISDVLISAYQLYDDGNFIMAALLENDYRDFVYESYLQLPDDQDYSEISAAFADLLEKGESADTASAKLELLNEIRDRINTMAVYSLSPGKTPSNRDFVNYFLLENHKGYCTHFATAGVLLARMAGIPTRYSTGYIIVGDDFCEENQKSDGSYSIDVHDNRSHAWAEIYLDGYGWVPFEFTVGYSDMSINTDTTTSAETTITQTHTTVSTTRRTNTGSNSSKKSSSQSTTQTTTAAVSSVTASNNNGGTRHTGSEKLNDGTKIIILISGIAVSAIVIVILRRRLILFIRRRNFNSADRRKSSAAVYSYTEQLLGVIGIEKNQMSYTDFAELVEARLGGKYFAENEFSALMNTALQGSFGESAPDINEIKAAQKFAVHFGKAVYADSGAIKKIYLKYLRALI